MIELLAPEFMHSDERGKLIQLVSSGYNQVNVLYNKTGTQRGGHCHKINYEAFYVISGSVEVVTYCGMEQRQDTFIEGSFFLLKPYMKHCLRFPENCVLIALYDKGIELENGKKDIYMEG